MLMRLIAVFVGTVAVAAFFDRPQSAPRFYYGADCPVQNATAGRPTGVVAGIVLEGTAGNFISANLGCTDRPAAFRALARVLQAPNGRRIAWSGRRRSPHGFFRVTWEFFNNGERCRDFAQEIDAHGHRQIAQGTACQQSDGNWHLH